MPQYRILARRPGQLIVSDPDADMTQPKAMARIYQIRESKLEEPYLFQSLLKQGRWVPVRDDELLNEEQLAKVKAR